MRELVFPANYDARIAGVRKDDRDHAWHTAKMPVPDTIDVTDQAAMLRWATGTFGLHVSDVLGQLRAGNACPRTGKVDVMVSRIRQPKFTTF